MPRIGLAALLLVVAVLARTQDAIPPAGGQESDDERLLRGSWEIVSVTRDGEADTTHVGGTITLVGANVWFASRAARVANIDPAMS
jgi:hypothetical protein